MAMIWLTMMLRLARHSEEQNDEESPCIAENPESVIARPIGLKGQIGRRNLLPHPQKVASGLAAKPCDLTPIDEQSRHKVLHQEKFLNREIAAGGFTRLSCYH